jgi:hypothetical protein
MPSPSNTASTKSASTRTGSKKSSTKAATKDAASKSDEAAEPRRRNQDATVVRRYLTSLGSSKRKGRQLSVETLDARIASEADPVQKLMLIDKRLKFERAPDSDALETAFTERARAWGEAHQVSYQAWREMGVPARVLKAAGIART